MKQFQATKWTKEFIEIFSNKDRSVDIGSYEYCLNEWKSNHDKKMMKSYVVMLILFCAGLWALAENQVFLAVLLLAFAYNSNRQSSEHILVSEIMDTQRLLAMLINKQSQSIESIRQEIREMNV